MRQKKRPDYLRLVALLTVLAGILYFYVNIFTPRLIPPFFRIGSVRRPTTILILGTDITYDATSGEPIPEFNGRTDTILLMRLDPIRYKMTMFSIPRDSLVEIPGYGWSKINAANVFGGVELAKKTIEILTGRPIDYFIKVNPYAAVKLVDLLGGIEVYIDKDMYYVDRAQNLHIDLKQGWRRLSGKQAEGYIRFRHDFYGDIGRIGRQQNTLQTVFGSLTRPSNLFKAPLALQIAQRYIQTDLPFLKLIRLANFARMISTSDIRTLTASGESGTDQRAGAIWVLDKPALYRTLGAYF